MLSPGATTEICWVRPRTAGLSGGVLGTLSPAGLHSKVPAWCVGSWVELRRGEVLIGSKL